MITATTRTAVLGLLGLASIQDSNAECLTGRISVVAIELATTQIKQQSARNDAISRAAFEVLPTEIAEDPIALAMMGGVVSAALAKGVGADPGDFQALLSKDVEAACNRLAQTGPALHVRSNTGGQAGRPTPSPTGDPLQQLIGAAAGRAVAVAKSEPQVATIGTPTNAASVRRATDGSPEPESPTVPPASAGDGDSRVRDGTSEPQESTEALATQAAKAELRLRWIATAHRSILTCEESSACFGIIGALEDNDVAVPMNCPKAALGDANTFDFPSIDCSRALSKSMRDAYAEIAVAEAQLAKLGDGAKPQLDTVQRLRSSILDEYSRLIASEARRQPNYGIYAGPSLALQGDGTWETGTEFLGRFETEVRPDSTYLCWFGSYCRAVSEISIRTPGAPEDNEGGQAFTPFDESGVLRVTQTHRHSINDWFGVDYGVGIGTVVREQGEDLRARPFYRLGVHYQTLYADGLLGELAIGYMHDRSRSRYFRTDGEAGEPTTTVRQDSYDRIYMDAIGLFPNLNLGGWRLAARLGADVPIDGEDPADIRASILFYYAFNDWLTGFGPAPQDRN